MTFFGRTSIAILVLLTCHGCGNRQTTAPATPPDRDSQAQDRPSGPESSAFATAMCYLLETGTMSAGLRFSAAGGSPGGLYAGHINNPKTGEQVIFNTLLSNGKAAPGGVVTFDAETTRNGEVSKGTQSWSFNLRSATLLAQTDGRLSKQQTLGRIECDKMALALGIDLP